MTVRLQQRKQILTVGTGNIDLENLKVQNLEADCGIGNIDLGIDGKEIGL